MAKRGHPATFDTRNKVRQLCRHFLLSSRPWTDRELATLLAELYGVETAREERIACDEVIINMLIECCGGSFRDLRAEAGSWQSVVNEAALRIVKDSVDVNYVQEIVEMVEQSKQNLHQPWSDELSELSQDRDVYVRFQDSTPDEREQCLSPRDKSIRDISLRIYHHRRANRRVRSAHSIPKPVVPREDNQSWRYWIGEIPAESQGDARRVEVAKHLHQIRVAVSEAYKESDSRTELSWPDAEGQTLLHAFISLIDPRTMGSHDVQETLRVILSCSGDSLHKRNKHGETPLHLAVRFALPHVVTTLLRHFVSGLVNDEGRADLLRKAIDVSDNSGTSLFTDLHLTYWLARHSDEPEALHFEIDALICVRIIVNAMVGDTPAEDHTFREFRNVKVFTERRSYASKRLRWQPGRTPFIPSNNARRYRPIEPVGAHLQRQNYVGISQKAPQSPNDMSFREDNPPSYHGANNTMAPASDTASSFEEQRFATPVMKPSSIPGLATINTMSIQTTPQVIQNTTSFRWNYFAIGHSEQL